MAISDYHKYIDALLKDYGKTAVTNKQTGEIIAITPMRTVTMPPDYKWQLDALNHRLTHPENYAAEEHFDDIIFTLIEWLAENSNKLKFEIMQNSYTQELTTVTQ